MINNKDHEIPGSQKFGCVSKQINFTASNRHDSLPKPLCSEVGLLRTCCFTVYAWLGPEVLIPRRLHKFLTVSTTDQVNFKRETVEPELIIINGPVKWFLLERKPFRRKLLIKQGFPGGSVVKNHPINVGDEGSIPGLGRSLAEGNGNPLQYSRLENSMDRGAWWATVHGAVKSWTQLSVNTHTQLVEQSHAACGEIPPCASLGSPVFQKSEGLSVFSSSILFLRNHSNFSLKCMYVNPREI